jgi:hypothetical protein
MRGWFGLSFVAIAGSAIAFSIPVMIAVTAVLLLCYFLGLAYFTHGLEPATEIPVLTRAEAVRKNMRAMGRPTIALVAVAGAVFALLGAIVAVGRGLFWGWLLVAYGGFVCVLYIKQWLRFTPAERQPNEEL